MVTPEAKRAVVRFWREGLGLSERRACSLIGLDRSTHRYQRRVDRNGELRRTALGKIEYSQLLTFDDRATREAFSRAVIRALIEFDPHALDEIAA